MIAQTPNPPYYAVIFSTILMDDMAGYEETAQRMEMLAKQQKGYLGIESVRKEIGITVSYWKSEADIIAWKKNVEHTEAREKGRKMWYKKYELRVCKVERAYGFERE